MLRCTRRSSSRIGLFVAKLPMVLLEQFVHFEAALEWKKALNLSLR